MCDTLLKLYQKQMYVQHLCNKIRYMSSYVYNKSRYMFSMYVTKAYICPAFDMYVYNKKQMYTSIYPAFK